MKLRLALAAAAMLALAALNPTPAKAADVTDLAPVAGITAATAIEFGAAATMSGMGIAGALPGFIVGAIISCETKYQCNTSRVASAEEMQAARFAAAGIDTAKAQYTAAATDLGQVQRSQLSAAYNLAMGYTTENMAAASR